MKIKSKNVCPRCGRLITLGDFSREITINTNDTYNQKYIKCLHCDEEFFVNLKISIVLDGVTK